jgi:Ion channel
VADPALTVARPRRNCTGFRLSASWLTISSACSARQGGWPSLGMVASMRIARAGGVVGKVVSHPSAVLLTVQLVGVLIYPFIENTAGVGRALFEAFGAVVLALAIWTVRASPGPTWIAIILAVAAAALSIADAFSTSTVLQLISAGCHALFYFWAAGSLMVYMLADREVTTDELYAVGATFTLVAWAFAYLFVVMQIVQPGCFIAAINADQPRSWMELLFLSFTNLSSTGLSDVVPVTPHARAVVMMEQLAGLGYVALFVSRLVGLTISRQMTSVDER